MQLQAFFATLRRWFGHERAFAWCPVAARRRTASAILLGAVAAVRVASASVLLTGDFTPADNPFTTGVNEGLPSDGNFVNPFEAVDMQTFFEGIHSDGVDGISGTTDDTNILNFPPSDSPDIVIGRTAFGTMLISGESALRDQNLIIGDSGLRNGTTRFGTGVVRITGFGSLYNNDPSILPSGLPSNFKSKNPRPAAGADGMGNDLYVGRNGTGTLEISAGARAEIQDATVVAANPGTTGSILVDGLDSFLGTGGWFTGVTTSETEIHSMIIGQQGVGYMTVTNGATVESDVVGSANNVAVAASIGSLPYQRGFTQTTSGGSGTVTIDGTASKWIVSGSLQVGGFADVSDGLNSDTDLEGDNVLYNSKFGQGQLNVSNGAVVNIHGALNTSVNTQTNLFLAIGFFGRLNMNGGLISIGDVNNTSQQSRGDNNQIVNDGIISGTGRIETGVFRNRYRGRVEVSAGQSLVVNASGNFSGGGNDIAPLLNFGVVQVLGTEDQKATIEFERGPDDASHNFPIQPFQNLRITRPVGAPIADFYGGLISCQSSIMHFRSGLVNAGMVAFTRGTNYVTGNVVNLAAPVASPTDPGIVTISGPQTKVTFEEDFINAGTLNISGGATLEVLARHSFVTAGELKITLDPQSSNQIFSAGDAGITGKLIVSLSGFAPGSIQIGDSFKILEVTGSMGGVDLTNPNYPTPDLSKSPLFTQLVLPSLVPFGLPSTAHLIPVYTTNSILLSVQTIGTSVGPDFNGDGVIDVNDLFIWYDNVGITAGATVLQGDADGDGDVDGADFLFWQRNVGKSPPWTGAGAGSGVGAGSGLSAAVPEPTSMLLVLLGAFFTLPVRRRQGTR